MQRNGGRVGQQSRLESRATNGCLESNALEVAEVRHSDRLLGAVAVRLAEQVVDNLDVDLDVAEEERHVRRSEVAVDAHCCNCDT